MSAKRIIFISNTTFPDDNAGGGSAIIYRHLKRFALSNYNILIVTMLNPTTFSQQQPVEFPVINVAKKWWFPPLRKGMSILTNIRMHLETRLVLSNIQFNPDEDIILGLLGEVSNLLILNLYAKFKVKYYLFFHDDTIFNRYADNNLLSKKHLNNILYHTQQVFSVSDVLTDLLKANGFEKSSTLYPIPHGYNGIRKDRNNVNDEQLKFCVSGMIDPIHFDVINLLANSISKHNDELICISNFDDELKKSLNSQIQFVNRFENLKELFSYLIAKIDVMIVFYSFDAYHEPRLLSSFPSKLLEYCHLGIPILIIAPAESTLGKWAIENNWLSYLDNDQSNSLDSMIKKLADKKFWQKCKDQCLNAAENPFNPAYIHKQLTEYLIS